MDSIDLEREKGITIMAKNTAVDLPRRAHQHRRHPRPRRLRRRGRAHPGHGRRRDAARRRLRGPAAADPLRAAQGARARPAADRRHQQDRPPRRAAAGGPERDLRPLHRPRRRRGAARLPGPLLQRPRGHLPAHGRRRPDETLEPLFEAILRDRAGRRATTPTAPLQILVTNLDYDDYVGRLADRPHLQRRACARRQDVSLCRRDGSVDGGARSRRSTATRGCAASRSPRPARATSSRWPGSPSSTSARRSPTASDPRALPPIHVDEPTITMVFGINTSPFVGPRGTARHLAQAQGAARQGAAHQRLDPRRADRHAGRLQGLGARRAAARHPHRDDAPRGLRDVGRASPRSITREIDGVRHEPMETLVVDCPEEFIGVVTQKTGARRGRMMKMVNHGTGPRAHGVPHPVARADRLPHRVPHRHARHRHRQPPVRRLGAVAGRHRPPRDRRDGRRPRRPGHRLRHRAPAAARRAVRRARRRGLRGDGRRRERPRGRHRRQHHQGEEAHQHARLGRRRGGPPGAAAADVARAGARVHPRATSSSR